MECNKRSKPQKILKERILVRRNMTKRANFRGSPLSQCTYNSKKTTTTKTEKQAINLTYFVSTYLFPPASHIQLTQDKLN